MKDRRKQQASEFADRLLNSKYVPVVATLVVWFLFASPYFLRGLIPFPSDYLVSSFAPWSATYALPVKNNAMPDVLTQIVPWKMLTVDTWKIGQVPLWNPYSLSGTVHAANYQSAVFTPFNLLFLILPFLDAWSLMILLQPLLAGLFTYLYVRRISVSRLGGLIAAFSFMFCGFFTVWMAYGTLAYAVVWMPLGLYMVERFREGWSFAAAGIALSVALSFVSGHFQISLYAAGAIVLYACVISKEGGRFKWRQLFGLLGSVGAGVLVSAVQLLPSFQAYLASSRKVSFVKGEIIPWQYLVTLFAPDFYGNPVTRNDWFGHYAEWNGFIGVVPLLLAMFGLAAKQYRKWFFIALGTLALALSYRTPLTDLMFALHIPVVSTSAASRIIVLFSFSAAVLAGFGADSAGLIIRSMKRRQVILALSVVAVAICLIWGMTGVHDWFPAGMAAVARHNLLLPTMFAGIAVMVFLGNRFRHAATNYLIAALVLLTAADMLRFAIKWMPFTARTDAYPGVPVLSYLTSHAGIDRVFGNLGNEAGGVFRLQLIEGYDAMYANRYGQFMHAVSSGNPSAGERSVVTFDKHGRYALQALQLLGVRYVAHRRSDGRNIWAFPYWEYPGAFTQVFADDTYWVYEYTDAFPRAFLASSYVVARGDQESIGKLFSAGTNRRDTLILETEPSERPRSGTGSASIVSYAPDAVELSTSADVPKLLFLSDAYDPGWHATVDGTDTPIYRADYDFRAVALPPGNHSVRFTYNPDSFRYGFLITAVTCMLGMAYTVIRGRRVRK